MAQSEEAFQAAVQRLLPLSAEQGRAYFKLADAQFRQKRFTEAIANYTSLVSRFASLEEVKSNLFEPALYQTVQAGLAAGDLAAATNALAKILAWYPDSFVTGSALLMTGQAISRHGDPAGARALFLGFSTNAPSSALLPVVKLAIARTYEMENNWDAAIQQYDVWLDTFTNHQARASAEYYRAWANDAAGRQTNALRLFTNFVARFPASPLTPRAQWWVADYYFRLGDTNYLEAEKNYQLVFLNTNLSPSPLKFRAIMMAGQAAVGRSSWEDAMKYFTNLTSDLNCPADLRAQALFAYGDYWTSRESTNKLADYAEAIKVFSEIGQSYPTNHLAVLALGRMASCLLQLKQFEAASNTYQQVIVSPLADATTRSRAKVGLAIVLEKEAEGAGATERIALLKGALNQCLDVVLAEGQEPDPFWMKEAGLKAGKLAEAMEDWETAIKVYKKLSELLPALRPSLEERRLKAEKHLEERWKLSG